MTPVAWVATRRRDLVITIPNSCNIDLLNIKTIQQQLWAQAVASYGSGRFNAPHLDSGCEVALPEHLREAALTATASYVQESPLREKLAFLLDDPNGPASTGRLWGKELHEAVKAGSNDRFNDKDFKAVMHELGWSQREERNLPAWGEARRRSSVWERKAPPPNPEQPPSAIYSQSLNTLPIFGTAQPSLSRN